MERTVRSRIESCGTLLSAVHKEGDETITDTKTFSKRIATTTHNNETDEDVTTYTVETGV